MNQETHTIPEGSEVLQVNIMLSDYAKLKTVCNHIELIRQFTKVEIKESEESLKLKSIANKAYKEYKQCLEQISK